MNTPRRAGLMLLAVLAVYWPALWGGFIWDDNVLVAGNRLVKASDGLYRFWCTTEPVDYWPVTSSLWWAQWRLWGDDPRGYHLANVLLHALNAMLLWQLLERLRAPGAWLAGLLFAVHPVCVETAAWIAETKNTLSLAFALASVLLFLKAGTSRAERDAEGEGGKPEHFLWRWLALGAFVLALLSKSAVAPLPCVLLALAWWQRGRLDRRDLMSVTPYFLAALAAGLVTIWFQYNKAIDTAVVRTDGLLSRFAIAGWAVWFYLGKALAPVGLSAVYPRWTADLSSVWTYAPVALALAAVAALRRWRPLGVALGCFVLLAGPVLGFLNIYFMRYSLVANHWLYIPMVPLVALVAWLPRRWWPVAGAVALAFGVLAWQRARLYGDAEALWRDAERKNPDSWVVQNNLGNALLMQGRGAEALARYRKAHQLDPRDERPLYNAGLLYAMSGQPARAAALYWQALALNGSDADTRYNLGLALGRQCRFAEAAACFRKAAAIQPDFAAAYYNWGFALTKMGRHAEAVPLLRRALELSPDSVAARYQLALALNHQADSAP
jgi:tetratricopeptide (TPR) repeat protein